MKQIRDFMATALMTVSPDDPIGQADDDMKVAEIRHLPVVDKGKLVGIVSNRDILKTLRRSNKQRVTVRDIMTTDVHTVSEDAPAYHATELMLEYKIGAVPVVGDDGRLIGLVTETDFLQIADEALRD